ncbi:conserved protein of unknown function [Rhodovastum atsumiense]|uniref:DUF697 domain-containing protein n=1 Tax=Rhodovastum atsumiense TaxID=504468 RepID=A0A5M6J3I4_9PROT|nr:DUF697 domain-containing protein [Rhodovastum atsumiense]KAA5614168.1 DUF697 domain-containing protein [Rhodovastum atsumiense]CAH2599024.1 conserved protein of unknown function [Rhodovastum atsumiense]
MIPPRIPPRFELEDAPVARLEPAPEPDPIPVLAPVAQEPRGRFGNGSLLLAGSTVLLGGFTLLGTAGLIADQFARSAVLGWGTLAVAGTGFGLIGTGIWRELRALFALREVDRIRADLASGDALRVTTAARDWLRELPDGAAMLPTIERINDPDAVLTTLRTKVMAGLQSRADALGRAAAVQVFAATAAVPSPALDAVLVAWRGTRLIRQIAELHGLRPGLVGTMSLLRRTALSAAGVAATDMAIDAAARAALSNPLLQHLAGDVAGAGVAARRMVVLARAAGAACSPLPAK